MRKEHLLTLKDKAIPILLNQKVIFIAFCLVTIIATIQKHHNNLVYLAYKMAGLNLVALKNIYAAQPPLDYYLYSPTFATFFLSFAYLPDILGSVLWNLTSIILLLISINLLKIENWKKSVICGIIFFGVLNCLQNFQANILVTAFILFAFVTFEKNQTFWAAFCAMLGFFAKFFGAGFAVLFLFYPKKIRFVLYLIISTTILFLIPLLFIRFDIHCLITMYKLWWQALGREVHYPPNHFMNIYTMLKTWFNFNITPGNILSLPSMLALIISLPILALPLLRISKYKHHSFRLMFLASLLTWVTLFNPKTEAPAYIIAITGVALWFISQKKTPYTIFLTVFAILFTSLSNSDLMPPPLKIFLGSISFKAFPCLVIWIVAQTQLLFMHFDNQTGKTTNKLEANLVNPKHQQ